MENNPFTVIDETESNPFTAVDNAEQRTNPFTDIDNAALDPVQLHDKAVATSEMSDELELPVVAAFDFHNFLTATPEQRKAAMFDPFNLDPLIESSPKSMDMSSPGRFDPFNLPQQFEPTPKPTNWQSFKKFFVGDRPSLQPNASRMEKFDRVFDTVIGSPLRVGLKAVKGMTLGAPDLMWAAVKRSVPADVWGEEMNNMTLDEAMDWAAGYNPSGFQKAVGEVAEFAGALTTVKPLLNKALGKRAVDVLGKKTLLNADGTKKVVETFWKGTQYVNPKGLNWLQKATETAYAFGIVSTADQIAKQVSEKIDPTDTDYGYEGPSAAIRDATIGFIFSLAGQGAKAAWKAARPTEQAKALAQLGLKKGATEAEIKTASRNYARQYHPDKVKGMEAEWKQFRKDLKTVAAGEEKDIVYRGAKIKVKGPKLLEGKIGGPPSKEALAAAKPEPVLSDGVELTPGQEQAGIVVAGNKIYQGEKLLFQATDKITPERVAQIARIHKIDTTEPVADLAQQADIKPLVGQPDHSYRTIDQAIEATGKDVSVARGIQWFEGEPFMLEIKGTPGEEIVHHPGAARGEVKGEDVTKIFYYPDAIEADSQGEFFGETGESELSKLKQQFPNAEVVKLDTIDNGGMDISYGVAPAAVPAAIEPPATPSKFRKGTAQVPRTVEDIAALTKYTVQTAGKYISDFGEGGTKLVDSVVKADEHATMRAGRANEDMHDAIKGLTKVERKSFGKAVNGIMYERLPKHVKDSEKWKNASDVWMEPISDAQRAAAEKYLEIADAALEEAGQLGFERQFLGGGKAATTGGGIPWPQRLNRKGEKAMEKALRAVTGEGELDYEILKKNDLVNKMIERGLADGPGDAWTKLQQHKEHMKRLKYGMFEGSKIQLPEEYVKLDSHDVLGQPYWKNMFMQVEMAKNLGGADYPDAAKNIAKIKAEFGESGANEAQQWLDRINGIDRLNMTPAQRASERLWGDASAYQTLKLSPATAMQNWFQPLIGLTDFDPRDVFAGLTEAYMPKIRKAARQSGAIPHDPFESSIAADFRDAESGTFMKKIARAWSWSIGMSATERGNNYKSAIISAHGVARDLAKLQASNTKLGQLARNIISLGGDSPGAIKRRLGKHGINWEEAMDRGYLTVDEIAIAAQRGSKRSNFRSDLFTTPLWWQKSAWMRAMAKYKIPFAYNYTNKMWEAASEALKHGNMRPALAFLAVTTLTGEIYNYAFREKILGESREDQSTAKRLWEDLLGGAGLGIFGALMFGYDARSTLWNFIGGPMAKTVDNTLRTYQDIKEAPEHTRDHLIKLYEREFPVGKYFNQIRNRPQHQADVARWKIRELWPDKDTEKFFYGDDLYDSVRFDDFTGAMSAVHNVKRLGADKGAILSALTAKRPVKVATKDRAEWNETLTDKQKTLVASEESAHQLTLAKAKSLLALGKVDPEVTDFYVKLDKAKAKATQAKLDGEIPARVLSIDDLRTIAIYSRISSRLTQLEEAMMTAESDKERADIYDDIVSLYNKAIEVTD